MLNKFANKLMVELTWKETLQYRGVHQTMLEIRIPLEKRILMIWIGIFLTLLLLEDLSKIMLVIDNAWILGTKQLKRKNTSFYPLL